jgi:pretoxin HINT domain-containing protein
VHGAVVGGVTGFFACLGAPEVGAGFLGGFASGAVGGAVGNVYGQATAIAFGWQDCFNWPELLASAAFGGAVGGLTNVLGGAGGAVPEGSGCFTAGTPLVLPDGTARPIEQIKQGDRVLAKDPVSGTLAAKRVTRTFVREVNETLVLTLADGQRIETTANHPFFVEGQGFVPAGRLGIGTLIVTRAGPAVKLVKAEKKVGQTKVYNLEVDGFHSYFVGTGGTALWVHNAPCNPAGFTRVGRWMSQAEYEQMVATGRVQPTQAGLEQKSVTVPPDPDSYRAAGPGSVFVEFHVPTSQLAQGGKTAWGTVFGPESIFGRLAAKRGISLPAGMPEARNIVITGRK